MHAGSATMLRGWQQVLLAASIGAGHTWAYVDTGRWWLQPAAVALLVWLLQHAPPRRAALLGFGFGTAWLCAGTWWLFISMHRYGGLPAWMAALAVLALASFLSLYLAAACAAWARWRSGRAGPDAALFGALWLLAELARGVIFTGFPWVASGYAHVDSPLARLAPFIGAYGIGALAALLSAWAVLGALSGAARTRWRPALAGAALLTLLALLPPAGFSRPAGSLDVVLLQGNVPQDEKFAPERIAAAIDWHVRELLAARDAGADLVVAPETALVLLPDEMPAGLWAGLRQAFAAGGTHALFGVPLGSASAGYTNSAVGLGPAPAEAAVYRYDKHHLVPFGEFIPLGFRWFTNMMNIPLGDFDRGPLSAPSMQVGGQRVAPNICYEDLFGEELAARFVDAPDAPTLLVNLSNIAWFGDTIAIDQHLQISRMRALELQRPMLRATNTGATVAIDHAGRLLRAAPAHRRVVLTTQVQGREGITPFAWWAGRLGLWPLGLAGVAVLLHAARRARAGRSRTAAAAA